MHQFETSLEMSFDHNRYTSKNDDSQSTVEQLPQDESNSIDTDHANLSQSLLFHDAPHDGATYANTAEISQGEDTAFGDLQYQQADPSNSGQCDDECRYHFSFSDSIGFFRHDEGEGDNDEIDDEDDEGSMCDSIRLTIRRRSKARNL
ncbi:hypothetical protein MHU86_3184 [Fragilaria crotonensis]|nr:hypothetical protein MHU86_3184 [Fragilaria crotonensis]